MIVTNYFIVTKDCEFYNDYIEYSINSPKLESILNEFVKENKDAVDSTNGIFFNNHRSPDRNRLVHQRTYLDVEEFELLNPLTQLWLKTLKQNDIKLLVKPQFEILFNHNHGKIDWETETSVIIDNDNMDDIKLYISLTFNCGCNLDTPYGMIKLDADNVEDKKIINMFNK